MAQADGTGASDEAEEERVASRAASLDVEEGGTVDDPDAEAAHAVHGGRDVAAKVSWVAEAARSLTGASFAAYVAAPEEGGGVRVVVGCPPYVVDEFAQAAAALLFAGLRAGDSGVRVADI